MSLIQLDFRNIKNTLIYQLQNNCLVTGSYFGTKYKISNVYQQL